MPQTSLSGLRAACGRVVHGLSLGFMPQTSLSVHGDGQGGARTPAVSGVHAPDFVERTAVRGGCQTSQLLSLGFMP